VPAPYEWAVLRVVPRVDRGESVNVGIVVYCRAHDFLAARVTDDLSRAVALDPGLDVADVAAHLAAVRALCAGDDRTGSGRRSAGDRFRWLVAPRSTVVQTSPVHPGLTDDPAAEVATLFARMVTPPPPSVMKGTLGRLDRPQRPH
jgi:hypothetical protein